jgi:hypothetical protein
MFDTFDVLVPKLLPVPLTEIRQHMTAFGPDERKYLYVGEVRLARVIPASVAFSSIPAWTGSPGRATWTALLLHDEANAAVTDDGAWMAFLRALRTILEGHHEWRVTCESDCDQCSVEQLSLTPDALVRLLGSYRETRQFPIAFCAESPGLT